jgi:peptidoglycan hydrolase-like protein with peptidoglycan-binding domain
MNLLSLLPLLLSVLGRNKPLIEDAIKIAVSVIGALPKHELEAPINQIDVRVAQAKLAGLGFEVGPIDGWPGIRTQAAVKKYQEQNNLEVDGLIGQKTWAHLIGET